MSIEDRIMDAFRKGAKKADDSTSQMGAMACELADLARKVDLERRLLQDRLNLQTEARRGQGLRIGSRVEHVEGGHKGTIIAMHLEHGEYGPEIEQIEVRWDDYGISICDAEDLDDITPKIYLNVYLHDIAWGGPEEGGWHFDTYEPVPEMCKIICPGEEPDLEALVADLNEGRRPVSSVLSEGEFVACLEAWPAELQPCRKPHYC